MKNKILEMTHILNISLLLVEDEEDARLHISNIIRRRVAILYIAKNAAEALEIYEEYKPDLILSDIQMPGMNGLQMAEIIREKNPKVKVIMMTAHTDTNYLMKAIELQVDGYIVKPIKKTSLTSSIKKQADYILTEKKIKEQKIEMTKSEEKHRLFFENNDAIILFVDPSSGQITYANKAAIDFYGYCKDQLIGMNMSSINTLPPEKIKEKMAEAIQATQNQFVFQHKLACGELRDVEIYQTKLQINNQDVFSVIVHDISDRKKAEESMIEYADNLVERNKELDEFSHTVAHDLKNPLANIIGFSNVLLDDTEKQTREEVKQYNNAISKSANKMQQIIHSLLLLANVRKTDAPIKEIGMETIVEETIKRLSPMINRAKAEIVLPHSWPASFGYAPWVEEIWTNYLSNAIKYGGSPPKIEMGYQLDKDGDPIQNQIRFWIRDNGQGISAENQLLLFEKFERLEQVKTEGHGLGLSIVRRIVEKLGGQFGVESNMNDKQGSLFYFTLPYNIHSKNDLLFQNDQEMSLKNRPKKLKILIVEDEEFVELHLKTILRKINRQILYAKTGQEALELCHKNDDIDLILMDIRMPIMDGYTATQKIREINKDVIIIAQTAYALPSVRVKCIEAGCNDYITKPINKNHLLKMIDNYFDL